MSHILNALNRASAERERSMNPDLQAVPGLPEPNDDDDERQHSGMPWAWIALGAAVGLLGALGWFFAARQAARDKPPVVQEEAAPGTPPRVVMAPVPAPTGPAILTSPPDSAAPEVAPVVPPAPRAAASAPMPAWELPDRSAPAPAASSGRKTPAERADPAPRDAPLRVAPNLTPREPAEPAAGAPEKASEPESAAAADGRIQPIDELPPAIRRELPAVSVNMSVYADKPADRRLFVRGTGYGEGDKLGPNLILEEIQERSAVLRYKGYRYRISF
jgi:general secretion pathway protein B